MRHAPLAALPLLILACAPPSPAPSLSPTRSELRPTEAHPLWRYDEAEVVEAFDSERFRVHFTREGPNAVPDEDIDGDGIPDYVALVAAVYEDVLDVYNARGFRAPLSDDEMSGDNGGDGRFDVYLIDFGGQSDGAFSVDACLRADPNRCQGYMLQENDFEGYHYPSLEIATRILGSHELFHGVQAAYHNDQGVVFSEGMAVWASDVYDPELGDLAGFVGAYLDDPGRTLDVPPPGPVPSFAYGASIFFRFLHERFGEEAPRLLLERVEAGAGRPGGADSPEAPYWISQLDLLLEAEYDSGFAEAFFEFGQWNLYTTRGRANDARAYADGARYPSVAMTHAALPFFEDRLRVYAASTQYLEVDPGTRAELTAALTPNPSRPDQIEGLRLVLGFMDGMFGLRLTEIEPTSQATIPTSGVDAVFVMISNPAMSGDSRKPGLCIGDPEEVAACVAAVGAEEEDAGLEVDAAMALDAGGEADMAPTPEAEIEADAAPTPEPDAGGAPEPDVEDAGGCQAWGDAAPWWAWWGLLLLGVGRRGGAGALEG